jgi:hypothetical protein
MAASGRATLGHPFEDVVMLEEIEQPGDPISFIENEVNKVIANLPLNQLPHVDCW